MNVLALTKMLAAIPSATGSEGAVADYLSSFLRELGFKITEQSVEPERRNIFAVQSERPCIVFCTHMDTVAGMIEVAEDETFIYGRGACDAKGIIAAMITAAGELGREGRRDIGLMFVVGEETDSLGARRANALNVGSRFVIVGEPTENILGRGHKGILTIRLTTHGRRVHSAFPHLGDSAVEKLLDVLADLRRLDFSQDPILGPTLMSIVQMEGGIAPNVIPDAAQAVVSLRTSFASDAILDRCLQAIRRRADVAVITKSDPQILHTLPGFETAVLPFGSDIPHLKSFGKALLIGPGSPLDAHTELEKIDKNQLRDAVRIYKDLARRLVEEVPT